MLDEGLDVTLFEASEQLGGVWRENYAGFGIQVPSNLYEFPDEPLPERWDFCAGPMMGTYIQQYAQKHGVYEAAEFGAEVEKIAPKGDGYEIFYRQGGQGLKETFDLVIMATGVYGKKDKFIPDWKGKEAFRGELLHCSDYFDASLADGKHVVTVGYGKSAFDCAQISLKGAASSTLLFRQTHWVVPRKILDLIPFEYATFSRFGASMIMPLWPSAGPFEKLFAFIPGLLTFIWWLVGQIFAFQFGLKPGPGEVDLVPDKGIMPDLFGGHGILPHPDFFKFVRKGDQNGRKIKAVKGEIAEIRANSLILKQGAEGAGLTQPLLEQEIPCDVLIAGTGYKQRRTFLPDAIAELKEQDGFWLYRNMVLPDHPRFIFLNSESTTFTNITTASLQARWVMEMIAGNFKLPSSSAMHQEIDATKAWKRKTMPNAGACRAYMIQLHQVHYYDELLKDMGVNIRRKAASRPFGAIREVFEPYRPRDYDTVITGEFKFRDNERCDPGAPQANFAKEGALAIVTVAVIVFLVDCIFRGLGTF